MSENVVENGVETDAPVVTTVKQKRPKRPGVSALRFTEFVTSGETASMTQAEAAAKLGMTKLAFTQRLVGYRKAVKHDIEVLKAKDPSFAGTPDDYEPEFKSDARGGGRRGHKKAMTDTQAAVLAFIQKAKAE